MSRPGARQNGWRRGWIAAGAGLLAVAGVGAVVSADHFRDPDTWPPDRSAAQAEGALSLPEFFDGSATSSGTITTALIFDEAFTATFAGTASGNGLQLDERFEFDDGSRLQRWDLARLADGTYRGTVRTELSDGTLAPAVPVAGWTFADGVVLAYDGYAPGGGHTLLGFRHVMRPLETGNVRNRVTISKFGVAIASADVTFRRGGGPAGQGA
ncbi:DUF3833 family protein [Jiella pacifica]|uniref:DUF3833 family protein n=1 Tax=Jiella pacifica TaxID=2696469 RepID=A0A6N9SVD4_9HYPH|nr:DUF3833 family protein [Jiella pacifica]NDW03003.1 DUF3833 family protein [Jiella pacifica]